MPAPRSKRQAGLMGVVASGKKKIKGLTQKEARNRLRGTKVSKLPTRKRKGKQ